MQTPITELAREWLRLDRDPQTRTAIEELLARGDHASNEGLEACLRRRITFGTAGLRAKMAAGFSRMNNLTVIQTSQGLAAYMIDQIGDAQSRGIVIGHDARHHSAEFALHATNVFLDRGFKVYSLGQCHTPLVPFAVGKYSAAGGVMVTASHNPKDDNGYKVYWSNGSQIIPPHDSGIAKAIEDNLVPSDASWASDPSLLPLEKRKNLQSTQGIEDDYVQRVVTAAGWTRERMTGSKTFTYTPMHGVGLSIMQKTCAAVGLEHALHIVDSQAQPDPEFRTVAFPNPEEKGALDEAKATATANGDSLILANDPDADRFAVAEYVDGKWVQFTGNQLGVLLGIYALESHQFLHSGQNQTQLNMLASAVSSRMLAHVAKVTGDFHFEETLTGFKWLGNKAQDLDSDGSKTLYAYEEAIGFMLPSVVYDKDGIVAAALFMTAVRDWAAKGLTPWQRLQQLYQQYGYFEEANTYLVSPSPEVTNKVFEAIRAKSPKAVGKRSIERWRDLTVGYDSGTSDHVPTLPVDKSAQMITCELQGDVVFTVRGSGTEPKIKLYIEGRAGTAASAKAAAEETLKALLDEWFIPEKYGLRLA